MGGRIGCKPCGCSAPKQDDIEIVCPEFEQEFDDDDEIYSDNEVVINYDDCLPEFAKSGLTPRKKTFEDLLVYVQSSYRGYIFRKKFKAEQDEKNKFKGNIEIVAPEEFNNDRWDKFFSRIDVDINRVPDLIEEFYNNLFDYDHNAPKSFSLKVEDYELKENEIFEKKFQPVLLKNMSKAFNIGPHEGFVNELKIFDEDLIEHIDSGFVSVNKERKKSKKLEFEDAEEIKETLAKLVNRKSDDTNTQMSFKINSKSSSNEEIKSYTEEESKVKHATSLKPIRKRVSYKNLGKIDEENENPEDRDKLPKIFEKEFNKEEKDKENQDELKELIRERLNTDIKDKSKNAFKTSNAKYVYNFKFICEELYRNDKENITEETYICDKDESTYFRGTFHKILKEKYGFGTQYMINKSIGTLYKYKGFFQNNKFNGYGILQKEGGYLYYGEFRDGSQTGYGIEVSDSGLYKGLFLYGKYHGYGEFEAKSRKYSYKGGYYLGHKDYLGELSYDDGNKYLGFFKSNQMNGLGYFYWHHGHKYFGKWKGDKMHGRGKYIWKTGDIYIGNYENDKKHGEGVYIYEHNGAELRGNWKNGKKEGAFLLKEGPTNIYNIKFKKDQQVE